MRYCKGCGSELPDGAVFCPTCGRNVQADAPDSPNGQNNNWYGGYNNNAYQNNNYAPNYGYDTDRYTPMTIVGFVFSFISSIVGLIISIIAYNDAKRMGSDKNMSMSKAGIIISAVHLGINVVFSTLGIILVLCGILTLGQIFY